jgi:hypothetical protein
VGHPLAPPDAAQDEICSDAVSAVLLIDNSYSMVRSDPEQTRLAAAGLFADLFFPEDQIAIL